MIAAKGAEDGASDSSHYTIVRKTTNLDRMFYTYHRLGIQSNVLVAARYASAQPGKQRLILSDDAVFSALHAVVVKYPELGLVGVVGPAAQGDKHLLSLATLNEINLERCVEFVDDDTAQVDAKFLETLHGKWHWADGTVEAGVPWWKIIVVGRRDVVFVYHHLVCDGAFGMTFHRELLDALNASAVSDTGSAPTRTIKLDPERVRLSMTLENAIHKKPAVLGVIYNLLVFLFYRFFYAKKLFFVNFPKPKELLKDSMAVAGPSDRTVTKVTTCRIPPDKMNVIIKACRAHDTTFTPFLAVVVAGTLAADFYPHAEVGFTRYAVDMRATGCFDTASPDEGKLLNLAASLPEAERLKKYRQAFSASSSVGDKQKGLTATVDSKVAWELIRDYGRRMVESRSGGDESYLYKAWISGNALGPSLEEFAEKLPSMGLFMQNSFSVSNVGCLKAAPPSLGLEEPVVKIEDVQFSAGPVQGAVGYHGIVFNVAGVTSGDTVINVCTEGGMAPEGMVEAVLDGVMARVNALLQEETTPSEGGSRKGFWHAFG
ncbi:alcohol acetyltransferase-domain-containing protein [Colletotrichum godetiae]|uniref:Alcohol acetyltransferase-domain-containing protein n=1 Tax=Colletotrichum godetiae TaxID=1209918 RepID=A0AAJ0AMX5_9PEZI|nr:alcohol acetyltransferase-domain-containing protein [Colletotrichum godetiae]KAK1675358.1 alcohol acetyltransferase-domain-containing protein [Colletotrichum godetiae]